MGTCIVKQRLYSVNNDTFEYYKLEGKYVSKIVDVYDGDTCTVVIYNKGNFEKHKLRLKGIDTPELKPKKNIPNRDLEISKANAAKNELVSLTLNKIVTLDLFGYDKYGRLLGDIYINNKNINLHMIDEKFAKAYDGGSKT